MPKRPYQPLLSRQVRATHRAAMAAKEAVFKAQDAWTLIPEPEPATVTIGHLRKHRTLARRLEAELGRARAALEALDRIYLDAGWADGGHCSCGGFGRAEPHNPECPLYVAYDAPHDQELHRR